MRRFHLILIVARTCISIGLFSDVLPADLSPSGNKVESSDASLFENIDTSHPDTLDNIFFFES